jgi:hypothetical protein
MIYTVNRSYKITFTKSSGFTYTITSSKASVTNIKNPTGTVVGNSRTINTVMYLNGLDAYNNNVITVTAIDTLTGCTITLTDNLTKLNPCNNLLIDIDNPINTLTYKAIVTSGKQPYSYKWSFNDNFQAIGITTNDTLNLRNITEVTPFNVSVEVTDFNGCKTTKIVSYPSSCKPTINNITATNECTNIEEVMYNKYIIELVKSGCGNLVQELIPLDNSFIYRNRNIGDNKYELIIDRGFTNNIKQFYVKNNLGYKSNNFGVSFSNTDCTKPVDCDAIVANDITATLSSESKETITKINVIGDDVDYNSFKFIVVGSQSSTSNTQLNTVKGVATYNPTTKEIKHIFTNTGIRGNIVINWSISDKCGNTITKTLTIITKVIIVPNVGGKQAKAMKGKTSSINIDGVDNLTIIKNPTSGVVSTSANTLTYNSSNIGVYDFELLPYNDGVTGLPFTTSYEVVSSGSAINLDFCTLGLINLQDYVSGASTGGNWYGVNNTVFISQSNQVDFTTLAIGSYQFQYVVTAGSDIDTTTVTFNKYSFAINSISVIPAQAGQFKVTINHTGLLIEDIITSVYILNGVTKSIVLDGEASATSFSFNVLTETITNLTYSINTVCGTKTISYVKPDIQVSTFDIKGKGIAVATLTEKPIKLVAAANNIVGRGTILVNPKIFSCDGTYTYTYDSVDGIYNGKKSTAAIAPVSPYGVEAATDNSYGEDGTRIYPENGWDNKGDLKSGYSYQSVMTNNYWKNNSFSTGPVNRHSIWANDGIGGTDLPEDIWIGFSKCITVASSKIYYVGLAGDNHFRLRLNGVEILNTRQSGGSLNNTVYAFTYWHIYPIRIPAGDNTLELTGWNENSEGALGCVIYDNTPAQLIAATSNDDLTIVFNSKTVTNIDIVQTQAGVYENKGYTCPAGYDVYSPCGGNNCSDYIVCGTPINNLN